MASPDSSAASASASVGSAATDDNLTNEEE
jgi:hypothetical protein